MYDYTSNNWSHWNSNEKLKEKFGSCTRKTFDRFTTKDSYTWNITHNTESTAVWDLKPERWGSPLVQEKYREEKDCDKRWYYYYYYYYYYYWVQYIVTYFGLPTDQSQVVAPSQLNTFNIYTSFILLYCVHITLSRYSPKSIIEASRVCLNLLKPKTYSMYHQFNIQQFSVLPTQCICVFCMDLRTNSDYFPIQH